MTKIETEHKLVVGLEIFNRVKYIFCRNQNSQTQKRIDSLTDNQDWLSFYVNKEKRLFDTAFLIEKLILKNRSQEHKAGDNNISYFFLLIWKSVSDEKLDLKI